PLSSKRHDLAQVGVAAPERAVKSLFARNPWEQRNIDAITDQPHINIVATDRQQVECQLQRLRGARAVDDRIDFTLTRGVAEFLANGGRGLALDADDVVGSILLRDGEFLGIASKCDHRRTAPEELGVLNSVRAQASDAEHSEDPTRSERARSEQFLDPAIRRHARVGERREFLEFETAVYLDKVACWDGDELGESAVRPEPWPAHVRADVGVADLAMTAGAVAPSGGDDHVITFLNLRRLGHQTAELVHNAGDLMTRNDWRRNVSVLSEIPVNELDVGATHSTGPDLDEHLIGLNVRNWHVFEDEAFVVLPDASCLHRCVLSCVGA